MQNVEREKNGKRNNKTQQQYQQQRPERRPTRYTPIGKETARVVSEWHDVCFAECNNTTSGMDGHADRRANGYGPCAVHDD